MTFGESMQDYRPYGSQFDPNSLADAPANYGGETYNEYVVPVVPDVEVGETNTPLPDRQDAQTQTLVRMQNFLGNIASKASRKL